MRGIIQSELLFQSRLGPDWDGGHREFLCSVRLLQVRACACAPVDHQVIPVRPPPPRIPETSRRADFRVDFTTEPPQICRVFTEVSVSKDASLCSRQLAWKKSHVLMVENNIFNPNV